MAAADNQPSLACCASSLYMLVLARNVNLGKLPGCKCYRHVYYEEDPCAPLCRLL